MIIVTPNSTNQLVYVSRYDSVQKYEILDHNTRLVFTGLTSLSAYTGRIVHSGLTYNFRSDCVYTYKAYHEEAGKFYLANMSFLQGYSDDSRLDYFKVPVKAASTFRDINYVAPTTTEAPFVPMSQLQLFTYDPNNVPPPSDIPISQILLTI